MTRKLFLCLLICALHGCAVREIRRDQDQIRRALLELYTNQIIDNLIRASNGMPIVQVDYTNAQGTVTVQQNGALGWTKGTTHGSAFSVVNTVMSSLSGQHTNQITLVGTPVTTHNEVYSAYLEFLSLPGSLMVSDKEPPPHAAHLTRECDGRYYWIPIEYRREFLKLALLTTVQRGQSLLPPDEYFSVSIQRVLGTEPGPRGTVFVTVLLDKPIPNDIGYFTFSAGSSGAAPAGATPPAANSPTGEAVAEGEVVAPGPATPHDAQGNTTTREYDFSKFTDPRGLQPDPTDRLTFKLTPAELATFDQAFPKPIKVYLSHRRPAPPSMEDLLQRANIQLQQIQLNQLRQSTGP